MPQFKVAKTDNLDKIINNETVEDKLYIYKETNTLGRLFYDYADGTRIEIGSFDNTYQCTDNLTTDVCTVNVTKLRKYLPSDELSTVDSNELQINTLVTSFKSLYVIKDIVRNTNKTEVVLRRIYTQHDLKWNDYYE